MDKAIIIRKREKRKGTNSLTVCCLSLTIYRFKAFGSSLRIMYTNNECNIKAIWPHCGPWIIHGYWIYLNKTYTFSKKRFVVKHYDLVINVY